MPDNVKRSQKKSRYQRFQACKQNFQVQCEDSRLIMEATEVESARERSHVGHTQLFLLRYQYAITLDKNKRNMPHIL